MTVVACLDDIGKPAYRLESRSEPVTGFSIRIGRGLAPSPETAPTIRNLGIRSVIDPRLDAERRLHQGPERTARAAEIVGLIADEARN